MYTWGERLLLLCMEGEGRPVNNLKASSLFHALRENTYSCRQQRGSGSEDRRHQSSFRIRKETGVLELLFIYYGF